MANSFRSAFTVSAILTLVTLPATLIGFFPITLMMGMVSIICLILWVTTDKLYGDEEIVQSTAPRIERPPVDVSAEIVVGSSNENDNKTRKV